MKGPLHRAVPHGQLMLADEDGTSKYLWPGSPDLWFLVQRGSLGWACCAVGERVVGADPAQVSCWAGEGGQWTVSSGLSPCVVPRPKGVF